MRWGAYFLVFLLLAFPALAEQPLEREEVTKLAFNNIQTPFYNLQTPDVLYRSTPQAEDPTWSVNNPLSQGAINHENWNLILSGMVFEKNRIRKLMASAAPPTGSRVSRYQGRVKLLEVNSIPYFGIKTEFEPYVLAVDVYLRDMRQIKISEQNRDEQLAYWLNVRNALVIRSIFENYPLNKNDLRDLDLRDLFFGTGGVWSKKQFLAEDRLLSIQEIEELIVGIWNDPLVLYGFFYGTQGGPFIMNQAFTGFNVYGLLEKNARDYLNSPKIVSASRKYGLTLPIIYVWHSDLFNNDGEEVIEHIKTYAEKKLLKKIAKIPLQHVSFDFNWKLNDMKMKDYPFLSRQAFENMRPFWCGGLVCGNGWGDQIR